MPGNIHDAGIMILYFRLISLGYQDSDIFFEHFVTLCGKRKQVDIYANARDKLPKVYGMSEHTSSEAELGKLIREQGKLDGVPYESMGLTGGDITSMMDVEAMNTLSLLYRDKVSDRKKINSLHEEIETLQIQEGEKLTIKKLSSTVSLPEVKNNEVRRFIIEGNKALPSDLLTIMEKEECKMSMYSLRQFELTMNITYREKILAVVCILVEDYEAKRHYYKYHIRRYTGVDGTRGPAHIMPKQLIPSYGKFLKDGKLYIPRREGPGDELVSLFRIEMMNIDKLVEGTK